MPSVFTMFRLYSEDRLSAFQVVYMLVFFTITWFVYFETFTMLEVSNHVVLITSAAVMMAVVAWVWSKLCFLPRTVIQLRDLERLPACYHDVVRRHLNTKEATLTWQVVLTYHAYLHDKTTPAPDYQGY